MTTLTIAMTTAIAMLKVVRTLRTGAGTGDRRRLARTVRTAVRDRLRTIVPIVLALAVIGLGTIVYAELVYALLEYAE